MAKIRDINIAKDIVKEYSTEEIIRFLKKSLNNYANLNDDIPQRMYYNLIQDVAIELDEKLNGTKTQTVL